jgi:hypothetical protein
VPDCPLIDLATSNKLWILEVFIESLVDCSITRSCKDVKDLSLPMIDGFVAIHNKLNDFMGVACEIILNLIADVIPEGCVTTATVVIVCLYKLTPSVHMLSEIMVEAITLELSRQRCLPQEVHESKDAMVCVEETCRF